MYLRTAVAKVKVYFLTNYFSHSRFAAFNFSEEKSKRMKIELCQIRFSSCEAVEHFDSSVIRTRLEGFSFLSGIV